MKIYYVSCNQDQISKLRTVFNYSLKYILFLQYFRSINAVSNIWLHFCSVLRENVFVGGKREYHYRMVEQFHSTIPEGHKHILNDFSRPNSCIRVFVSTIGFGLGVDIPHIYRVVHWGASNNSLQYWQEIGRAGHNGQFSEAVLFYVPLLSKNVKSSVGNHLHFSWSIIRPSFRPMIDP